MLKFIGAIACFVFITQAQAQTGPHCVPVAAIQSMLTANGLKLEVLAGDDITRAVAQYNAQPPITDKHWTIVWIVSGLEQGLHAILFGENGQICDRALVEDRSWREIEQGIRGGVRS
jgi:hypothetical protein